MFLQQHFNIILSCLSRRLAARSKTLTSKARVSLLGILYSFSGTDPRILCLSCLEAFKQVSRIRVLERTSNSLFTPDMFDGKEYSCGSAIC